MKALGLVLICSLLCPLPMALGEEKTDALPFWAPLSGGQTHLCVIDAAGLKCWGPRGRVTDLPALDDPFDLVAGDGTQCAHDRKGLHCWQWSDTKLEVHDYPELAGWHSLSVSRGLVCGARNEDEFRCVPNLAGPLTSPLELPLKFLGESKSQHTDRLRAVGLGACAVYNRHDDPRWHYERLSCYGKHAGSESEAKESKPYVNWSHRSISHLVARENLVCYLYDERFAEKYRYRQFARHHNREFMNELRCYDTATDKVTQFEEFPNLGYSDGPEQLTLVGNSLCALDPGPHPYRRGYVSGIESERRVFCGAIHMSSEDKSPERPLYYRKDLGHPAKIAAYGSSLCGLHADGFHCRNVLTGLSFGSPRGFQSLTFFNFAAAPLTRTLSTLAKHLYPGKASVLRAAAALNVSSASTREWMNGDVTAAALVLHAVAPLLEESHSELIEKSALPLLRRKLSEYDVRLSVRTLKDFALTEKHLRLVLGILAPALESLRTQARWPVDHPLSLSIEKAKALALKPEIAPARELARSLQSYEGSLGDMLGRPRSRGLARVALECVAFLLHSKGL